jgi:putative effector of murein hydrolase LrgA (UPF0299 family)
LVVALAALGVAEYYDLCTLFWFAVVLASIMTISIAATTFAYTRRYLDSKSQN